MEGEGKEGEGRGSGKGWETNKDIQTWFLAGF